VLVAQYHGIIDDGRRVVVDELHLSFAQPRVEEGRQYLTRYYFGPDGRSPSVRRVQDPEAAFAQSDRVRVGHERLEAVVQDVRVDARLDGEAEAIVVQQAVSDGEVRRTIAKNEVVPQDQTLGLGAPDRRREAVRVQSMR